MGDFSYEFVYWTLTKWPNTLTIRRQIVDELFKRVWPFY